MGVDTEERGTIDQLRVLIGGSWREGNAEPLSVISPSTGQTIASGRASSPDQVNEAVSAASNAFPALANLSAHERAGFCHGVAAALRQRIESMARDLALEQGKPLAEARIEISVAAEMFEAAAEDGKRLNGEILPSADTTRRI
ncbi:MAG: aldehyde dehydrogenase family protein, partial [Chloroflexia bacterium]|nr:aldehyde dehydrogenase family protein [Chloroflexia bacterium]